MLSDQDLIAANSMSRGSRIAWLRPLRKMLATRTSREELKAGLRDPPQLRSIIGLMPMPNGTSPSFAVNYCGSP